VKTWSELEQFAARRKLKLYNRGAVVVVHRATGDLATIASIHTGKALTGADQDRIARAAIEAAIREYQPCLSGYHPSRPPVVPG